MSILFTKCVKVAPEIRREKAKKLNENSKNKLNQKINE